MRRSDRQIGQLFSYLSPEAMVPKGRPLRVTRELGNAALVALAACALAFVATAINTVGYLLTGSPAALSATLKTGFWFIVSFSVPVVFGSTASRIVRGRRQPLPLDLHGTGFRD